MLGFEQEFSVCLELFGFRAWGFTAYLEQTTQVTGFQVSFLVWVDDR